MSARARRASARQDPELALAIERSLANSVPTPTPAPQVEPVIEESIAGTGTGAQDTLNPPTKRKFDQTDLAPSPDSANKRAHTQTYGRTLNDFDGGLSQGSQSSELTELEKTPEPPVDALTTTFAQSTAAQKEQPDVETIFGRVEDPAAGSPTAAESPMPPPISRRTSGRVTSKPVMYGDPVSTAAAIEDPDAFMTGMLSEYDMETKAGEYDMETKAGGAEHSGSVKSGKKRAPARQSTGGKQATGGISKSNSRKRSTPAGVPTIEGTLKAFTNVRKSKTQAETSEPGMTTPVKRAMREPVSIQSPAQIPGQSNVSKNQDDSEIDINDPTATTAAGLPSPPLSQPTLSPERDETAISGLQELSRLLTHREPMETKPLPQGRPEVWAPGRQELCETLPYYQAYNSGCYTNGGTIYAFMFDSAGVAREYMDENVVIARMGGNMGSEDRKGGILQLVDHDINGVQPQAFLNNIAQRNPIAIICGDKNPGSPTKMPHRYCVLDWFKPTHMWAEKTMGKRMPKITIKYRLERLDRTKPSWYAASTGTDLVRTVDTQVSEHVCIACQRSSVHTYLIGWMCLNAECPQLWKLPNGEDAPYGELDYHPAFLMHRVPWEREVPPFDLNPGVPQIGSYSGDNLLKVSTRGVVCPQCRRCNMRYLFRGWRCDTQDCDWRLTPNNPVVSPQSLSHMPWDTTSTGPSLAKVTTKPVVKTEVKYFHNYKVMKYTFEGVKGAVIVAKANKKVTSQPGGPDDMFKELQSVEFGLERRMLRRTADAGISTTIVTGPEVNHDQLADAINGHAVEGGLDDAIDEHDHEVKGEAGARMVAFGMNFGHPYKFIASGGSRAFEMAPEAVRMARAIMNWAQQAFVNECSGYQDFNEELIFAYMEDQKIKYHDDGEEGLGGRIATLSLGGPATMLLRVKDKYFCQVSNSGIITDEKPLPLPLLESSGYASGYTTKTASAALQSKAKISKDTYEGRMAAWAELEALKAQGASSTEVKTRSKELAVGLGLRRKHAQSILSFHLTHGDIVIMEGEDIQKFMEHQVEPHGNLRFALTCRTILPEHLTKEQRPSYEVKPDEFRYDGSAVREDGDGEAIVWA